MSALLDDAIVIVLAGGAGERLFPLTKERAKPAVYFGGPYRIIDFSLSNCINSGLRRIFIATQYKSLSLNRHIRMGWSVVSEELGEFIEILPPQKRVGEHWYQGTADAVYQNLYSILREKPEHLIVLSGDHVYKMDYARMLRFHLQREAAATMAVIDVSSDDAHRFGIMQLDEEDRVTGFLEKPSLPADATGTRLASMGLYIFRAGILLRAITADADLPNSTHDFGRDILPGLVDTGRLLAYDFTSNDIPGMSEHERGYWRDIGTIDAYWDASQDLVSVSPHFSLYNPQWPIYSAYYPSPPAKFVFSDREQNRFGIATDSMVSEGCIISGGRVNRSILGPRVRVNSFSRVTDSMLFDDVEVGRYARVRRTIVDKGVSIPPGVTIGYDAEKDRERFTVSEGGIVVVPKGAKLD